ncbi:hypothetical protein EF83_22605, partial [Bacillus subtilis]
MPKSVTLYDLLISCPSDVKEELKIINEAVDDFNRMFGHANNATINTKHWSKDSYPQSGGRPQELLNQQFVLDCDAAVAVFWTRFGTPTDSYGSGTEEEIEELIKSDKQVFLYFCEKPINPQEIDFKQYRKIQQFKERYGKSNIYDTFTNPEDFKKKFLNHLSLHFLKQFEKGGEEQKKLSNLSIKGVDKGKITDLPQIQAPGFLNASIIKNMEAEIFNFIEYIDKIKLTSQNILDSTITNSYKKNETEILNYLAHEMSKISSKQEETPSNDTYDTTPISDFEIDEYINDFERETISGFFRKHNLDIDERSFFDLGGLKINLFTGAYVGLEEAVDKYGTINQLYREIKEYNQWIKYFQELDLKYYLQLCLSNTGTQFDEDIDVKLFIKEGFLCNPKDIPIPEMDIIISAEKYVLEAFKGKKSLSIIPYEKYPSPRINIASYESYEKKTKYWRDKYIESLYNTLI